jgi:hypothetical protein
VAAEDAGRHPRRPRVDPDPAPARALKRSAQAKRFACRSARVVTIAFQPGSRLRHLTLAPIPRLRTARTTIPTIATTCAVPLARSRNTSQARSASAREITRLRSAVDAARRPSCDRLAPILNLPPPLRRRTLDTKPGQQPSEPVRLTLSRLRRESLTTLPQPDKRARVVRYRGQSEPGGRPSGSEHAG